MMLSTLAWAIPVGCFMPWDRHCSDIILEGNPAPRYTGICPDQAYSDPIVTTIFEAYAGRPGNRAQDANCWAMWYSGRRTVSGGCYYPPISDPPDPAIVKSSNPTYATPTGDACTG
jgi:hypothetical protein